MLKFKGGRQKVIAGSCGRKRKKKKNIPAGVESLVGLAVTKATQMDSLK